ncbi:hypothetical protein TIFTF001_022435 [Ficus carica]|uniref:Uncharacterized protein n=1 Tax=Ficus carica TaxID=3494 RepID=A0AA88DCT4_FICCA|nr:hypothetical protein TIFTF001_022435 [Ficus carica]
MPRGVTEGATMEKMTAKAKEMIAKPAGVIHIITGGPYIGEDTQRSQMQHSREAKEILHRTMMSLQEWPAKVAKQTATEITFSKEEAREVYFPQP